MLFYSVRFDLLKSFLISAKSDFKEVDEKIAKMDEMFKVVAKLYGEASAKPEELFNIFANFTDSFLVRFPIILYSLNIPSFFCLM